LKSCGGFFDLDRLNNQLKEAEAASQAQELWNSEEEAKSLLKKVAILRKQVDEINSIQEHIEEVEVAISLDPEGKDETFLLESKDLIANASKSLSSIEFRQKMSEPHDSCNAYLEITAGGGGTDAQDWAAMLLRMYLRWAENKGIAVSEVDYQPGEVAGIKGATYQFEGDYVYGLLRAEQGVHRLVRISPFNANGKRQTSFASVLISPELSDSGDVVIDDKDLRIDTYRSSGAGGQHVNKTDSAVRITHIPSGIVVACQNERSQHKNKDRALAILRSKLQQLEEQARLEKLEDVRGEKTKIDFGSQIRSYVLQPYRMVKDVRTNYETSSVDKVLDGDLDPFIEAFLLSKYKNV
jgi:peptide chain release factor 2